MNELDLRLYKDEHKTLLLAALMQVRLKGVNESIVRWDHVTPSRLGICRQSRDILQADVDESKQSHAAMVHCSLLLITCFTYWPKFSGNTAFPIKVDDSSSSATQFVASLNYDLEYDFEESSEESSEQLVAKQYLQLRVELLDFCINFLDKDLT